MKSQFRSLALRAVLLGLASVAPNIFPASPFGLTVGVGFLASPVVLALGVGPFGRDFGWHFAATVLSAHVAFGAALALLLPSRLGEPSR